jgi:hypothetical protein
LSTPALAEEEAPEFLLADFGVRIDLPDDWRMQKWADWEFKAEKADQSVKLFAWGAPYQQVPVEADLDAWAGVMVDKVGTIGGKDPKVDSKAVVSLGGRQVARTDVVFDFPGDLKGIMAGATFAVEGQMFHMGVIAADKRADKAREAIDMLVGRLEVTKPPADLASDVSAAGMDTKLPEGWRVPHAKEMKPVTAAATKLKIDDLEACWTAIHPVAAKDPDVMITCQGGALLGVVDSYSFEGVEAELRKNLWGSAPVEAATPVELADRTGFLYETPALAMGVVPYDQGITRTWALGRDAAVLTSAVGATLKASNWSGPHPTGLGDQVSYYISYRPTSPMVLGPVGLLLLLGVGLATQLGKGGNKYEDFE